MIQIKIGDSNTMSAVAIGDMIFKYGEKFLIKVQTEKIFHGFSPSLHIWKIQSM